MLRKLHKRKQKVSGTNHGSRDKASNQSCIRVRRECGFIKNGRRHRRAHRWPRRSKPYMLISSETAWKLALVEKRWRELDRYRMRVTLEGQTSERPTSRGWPSSVQWKLPRVGTIQQVVVVKDVSYNLFRLILINIFWLL